MSLQYGARHLIYLTLLVAVATTWWSNRRTADNSVQDRTIQPTPILEPDYDGVGDIQVLNEEGEI